MRIKEFLLILLVLIFAISLLNWFPHPPVRPTYDYVVYIEGNCSKLELLLPLPMDKNGRIPLEKEFEIVITPHGEMIKLNISGYQHVKHNLRRYGSHTWSIDSGFLATSPDVNDPINNSFVLYPIEKRLLFRYKK